MSYIYYKYHKQIDNELHKTAFRGKTHKIDSLLNYISPYKTTSEGETPLHLSLSKRHQSAANIFVKILEIDLTAARQFLKDHKLNVGLDNENFAFALGQQQIEMVNRNCGEMIVNLKNEDESTFHKCSFVLLKESIYSVPDVLVFRPNDQVQKFVLLSTVFHLMNENGVITLNVQRSSDHSTVLHLAASQGNTAMVMRLLDLGANPYLEDKAHQTAIGVAHSMGEFPTYVEICRRLNLNMFVTKDFVRLPVKTALWENVEFMIETLVALRMETYQENRDVAITTVLSMNEPAGIFLLSNILEKCLEKYGQYLSEKKLEEILMLVNDFTSSIRNIGSFLPRKHKPRLVIHHRVANTVLYNLVRNGSSNIICKIYREFPPLKTLLFEHRELALRALIECIQSNHVDLAQFLIKEHEDQINSPESWSQLLIAATAADLPGSINLMKLILEHSMTDPNLVLDGDQSGQTNALFVCISKGNLEKVKVILESGKIFDLNIIQTKYDSLLQSAICSMNYSTTPSGRYYNDRRFEQFKCLTNDLDTSEEEDEVSAVRQIETNDENATKYATMNEIFDLLIERGANLKRIDSSYRSLLHYAVEKSNKYVVERLLSLGLDPSDPDRNWNLPLHSVRNIEIFNILKNHRTFEATIGARNKLGAKFFHLSLRSNASIDLCSKFIDIGIDVNESDDSGNTILHYLFSGSISLCEFLINSNANINLKNSQGYTAAYLAISHNFDIAALLLKQPSLDLFTLTNTGKSYLTQLTRVEDGNFHEIKIALETRKDELNRLIELYCNETDDNGVSNLFNSTNNNYLLELLIAQPHIQVNVETFKHHDQLLHKVRNNVKFAKFLVGKGLDVNKIDGFVRSPLTQALTVNHGENVEVVKYLIEAGANVDYRTWQGTTPLHVACVNFNLESIKVLLKAGADFNMKNDEGKIPFECLPIEYRSIVSNIFV